MLSKLNHFSAHLFWDVDISQTDPEKRIEFIVQRVSELGVLSDWKALVELYGINKIAEVASTISTLDHKAASFIAFLSGTDKYTYKCYTTARLMPQHWNF